MIRSNTVNDVNVVPERLLVLLGDQDRPHLCPALPQDGDVVRGEEKKVRAHLTGHRQTLDLSSGYHLYLLLSCDVAHMQRPWTMSKVITNKYQ